MGASAETRHSRNMQAVSETSVSESDKSIIMIDADGDIVLQIQHETQSGVAVHLYRVNSTLLDQNSKYFHHLLQPGRFGEAANIEAKHRLLREQHGRLANAPAAELPIVYIQDVGRISNVKAIDALIKDFLVILHGKPLQTIPPVANLANIAIVADRFDALEFVKGYVRRCKLILALDGKTTPKLDATLSDEKMRQRLLVAVLLDHPPWVDKYSARLIINGCVGKEADATAALWWDIPSRLEEEMGFRRDCVLNTIQSLQSYLVALYTSPRERQCKLGYDSSAQCDSFQLGEMIRFFCRIGTLRLQGTMSDASEPIAAFAGDLYGLIESLRQVPEYQIDKFHSHCGIRTRIIPLLDLIQDTLQYVGICLDCWQEDRAYTAWIEAKSSLLWKRQAFRLKAQGHHDRHAGVREMSMATERDWT